MASSLSSHSDATATNNVKIKEETGASSARHLPKAPLLPLTKDTTSHEQKATKPNSSRDSSLSSGGQDSIQMEDDMNRTESAQHIQTRLMSRLNKASSASTIAANPTSLPQLRSDVTQLQQKHRATTTQANLDSKEDSQEKEHENAELKKSLQKARSQLTKQSGKLSSAEWKMARLKEELKKERQKVKSKREEYQKKIKSGPVTMGDDGQMSTLLSRLSDMCKDWAAKYAIPDEVGRTYNDTEKSSILNLLKLRYNAVSDHGKAKIFDGMTNCAELLVNAALTHLVWFEILNRPFYFVEHAGTAEAPGGIEEALDWLVQLGDLSGTVAQKLTYCWLGTLLKVLNPTTTAEADSELEKAARSKNKTMKDTAFKGLENVLKQHCGPLLTEAPDKVAKQRHDRLWHIFRQAHELSYKLWTQGYKIKCFGRTSLVPQFKNTIIYMQAHLTMLIDDTDTSRNGQEVYLVTNPYLEAHGNESGGFDHAIRVLNPATVCTAARNDLEQALPARLEERKKQDDSFSGSSSGTNMDDVQQAAQKNKKVLTEHAISIPGTKKKQQAASGFPKYAASPTVATGDASSEAQPPSFSGPHALDPMRAKNDHSTPDEHTQNFSESTAARTYRREDEFYFEQVNASTGKRKRIGMYVEIFEDAEAGVDSIADVSDNDEPTSKKGRNRRRDRSGQKEAANNPETQGKSNEPVPVPSSKPNSLRAGASKMPQGNNTTEK